MINYGLVRKLTIPRSASLTAPFTQGSRVLRKGGFQPLHRVDIKVTYKLTNKVPNLFKTRLAVAFRISPFLPQLSFALFLCVLYRIHIAVGAGNKVGNAAVRAVELCTADADFGAFFAVYKNVLLGPRQPCIKAEIDLSAAPGSLV